MTAPLTLQEYQLLAARTAPTPYNDDSVLMGALGLAGECGEVVEIIKKYYYHDIDLLHKIVDELGDVLWYVSHLASALDIPLGDIAVHNIDKLRVRYPEKFTTGGGIRRATIDELITPPMR